CAGAKSILDIPRTLEILETYGVPVVGYGTDDFPAFYLRSSGQPVSARVDSPNEAAAILTAHWGLGGAGVVVARPVVPDMALGPEELGDGVGKGEGAAAGADIRGPALTPFLLGRLAELTAGKTLRTNQALVTANARFAAQTACHLTE